MKSEIIAQLAAHAAPIVYPEGPARRVFDDRRSRPMALLCGTMALHGSKDPWGLPHVLKSRMMLEVLKPAVLHAQGKVALVGALKGLHRTPETFGKWLYAVCGLVISYFCGDAAWLWNNGNGIAASRLLDRLMVLPGLGPAKAMTLMRVLDRDWGVEIMEWEKVRPVRTSAMNRMAFRMGWDGGLILDNPKQILEIYDGMRVLSNEVCTERPACECCPMDDICPKNGMDHD